MVEMTETANILNNATENSLVLMDEIGRGTSTYDGLALAWASAMHLSKVIHAYTLFATHYFELTALPDKINNVSNVHMDAIEHGDEVVLMHSVKDGPANQSYGIQVASLAGIPKQVISAAKEHLHEIESLSTLPRQEKTQSDLFDANPLLEKLNSIDPDTITPKQAHTLLYELCALLDK